MWPFKKAPPPKPTPELKQFGDLGPDDFVHHPVWVSCHSVDYDEAWYDDTDEETFRPLSSSLPVGHEEMYLIRCALTLADGSTLGGCATPSEAKEDWGTIQPQVFVPDESMLGFWLGMFPREGVLSDFCSALGKSPEQVFPLSFSPYPGLTSAECHGTIAGFMIKSGDSYEVAQK